MITTKNVHGIDASKITGSVGLGSVFGRTLYVQSTHSLAVDKPYNRYVPDCPGTVARPMATIDYAIGQCTADAGDVIIVGPGHAETIAAAGGITLDVDGVTIIGVGNATTRPLITFTANASTFAISADDCVVQNLVFECDKTGNGHATFLNITGAYNQIIGCRFQQGATTETTLDAITLAAGSDYTKILGCEYVANTDGGDSFVTSAVASDHVEIADCNLEGNLDDGVIENTSLAWTYCHIHHNQIWQRNNAKSIVLVSTATGRINDNRIWSPVTAGGDATIIDGGECRCIENIAMDEDDDKSGVLTPSTTA